MQIESDSLRVVRHHKAVCSGCSTPSSVLWAGWSEPSPSSELREYLTDREALSEGRFSWTPSVWETGGVEVFLLGPRWSESFKVFIKSSESLVGGGGDGLLRSGGSVVVFGWGFSSEGALLRSSVGWFSVCVGDVLQHRSSFVCATEACSACGARQLGMLLWSLLIQLFGKSVLRDGKGGSGLSGDPDLTLLRLRMFLRLSAGSLSNCLPTCTGFGNRVPWHAL